MIQIEKHPLQPFLPPNARLLMLGSFPPPKRRWAMDFFYPNFSNQMWQVFGLVFFGDADHLINKDTRTFKQSDIQAIFYLLRLGKPILPLLVETAFIILRVSSNCFTRRLTSWMVRPLPAAIRCLRLPLRQLGF